MRRMLPVLVLVMAVPVTALAADREIFVVGTAKAARGQTATGVIEVPSLSDAALNIPVAVVHGLRPGKVLALVAGSHGTEYASIIALEKLIEALDPADLSGTVIIVPLINIPAFEQMVPHVNPIDGKNMNRFFPGKADGTQTERTSHLITRQVIEQSDHVIDLHGGDLDESLRPYAYWTVTGNENQDAISRDMALAFGLDHIIISSDRPKDPAASRYLENTATTRGKPSITVEAGHAGTTEGEDVGALLLGSFSVMRYLGIMRGQPSSVEHPVWVHRVAAVVSEATGIFYALVKRGAFVAKDMKIGYVTDYLGKVIFEARAPEAGIVLYIRAVPSMTKGESIANIGVLRAGGSGH
ncbi:MAG: succinylglutamate desuccinylase/aspartoacylase family protein [Acidobacteria bacterium]|nr:succinylglutamate desuccinylase/aspartoacylase family protein [Acidobacteriota bacterium]